MPHPRIRTVLFRGDTVKSKGAVVGVRDGFIVFAGPATVGQNKGVFIGIRTRKISQPESAVKAIKELAGVKSFVGRKTVTLKEDAILVFCPYVLKKPAPAELCDLLQQMLICLQPYAAGFDGKCEDCGTATVREIVLRNGTPGYHCAACQQRIAAGEMERAKEYAERPSQPVLGAVAGICATVAAAVVWGVVVYWIDDDPLRWHPKLHMVGAMWIGFAASLAIVKATGKATSFGRTLAVVLAFAGKMVADSKIFRANGRKRRTSTLVVASPELCDVPPADVQNLHRLAQDCIRRGHPALRMRWLASLDQTAAV